MNRAQREWLRCELDSIGMKVFSGSANFLLLRLPITMHNAGTWERLIVDHRIVVRNCGNFEGLDESYLRVAVRTRTENQRLVQALASVQHGGGRS
jgi:threonine-phosphate decarboxylase